MIQFESLNFLAIFVAGFAGYVLGAYWYSPAGFGHTWGERMSHHQEPRVASIVSITLGVLSTVLTAFALSVVIQAFGAKTFLDGAGVGLWVGLGLIATSMLTDRLFAEWDFQLFLINMGYRVCFVCLAGGILGFWR